MSEDLKSGHIVKASVGRVDAVNRGEWRVGDWCWFTDEFHKHHGEGTEQKTMLACVNHIGSNYVLLESAEPGYGEYRVPYSELNEKLKPAADSEGQAYLHNKIRKQQNAVRGCLEEIKELNMRLGLTPRDGLTDQTTDTSKALVVMSGTADVKAYEKSLVLARDKKLPELFEKLRRLNERMASWMKAETLPLEAQANKFKGSIEQIEDRIFNVSLYAGLVEKVVPCCEGQIAELHERVHVMQRMLYMDEECLLDYQHGGMEFKNIKEFDRWISKPKNRDRILPHQKCVTVMRIRRHVKDRPFTGSYIQFSAREEKGMSDKFTYLYIRNGERVSRLITELDFEEKLFPDTTEFDSHGPVMIKREFREVSVMTVALYKEECLAEEVRKGKLAAWKKANPKKDTWSHAPYELHHRDFDPSGWELATPDSIIYDDYIASVANVLKKYNRIALILQGLFDRSDVLKPHLPARLWKTEEFDRAVVFVYDADRVLTFREPPDFEEYRAALNSKLTGGCITVGQRKAWRIREGARETERRRRDYRNPHRYEAPDIKEYEPYNDPGPTQVAKVEKVFRGKATFRWTRDPVRYSRYKQDPIACVIHVNVGHLLNVSAYTPGDFLQFFQDPRTRASYLQWAPYLLAAEEYHAAQGNPQQKRKK